MGPYSCNLPGANTRICAFVILLAVPFIGGCSSTKIYPVCIYESTPSAEAGAVWARYKPNLDAIAANSVRNEDGAGFSLSTKALVLTALPSTHANIKQIWPTVACVGPSFTIGDDILLRNCQNYVGKFLDNEWREWPGPINVVKLRCQQLE